MADKKDLFIRGVDSDVADGARVSVAQHRLSTGKKKLLGEWWSEAGKEKLDREEYARETHQGKA